MSLVISWKLADLGQAYSYVSRSADSLLLEHFYFTWFSSFFWDQQVTPAHPSHCDGTRTWDGTNHTNLFNTLFASDVLTSYCPNHSWAKKQGIMYTHKRRERQINKAKVKNRGLHGHFCPILTSTTYLMEGFILEK